MYPVSLDRRQIVSELQTEHDPIAVYFVAYQRDDIPHNVVEGQPIHPDRRLVGKGADSLDHFGRPVTVVPDADEHLPRLVELWRLPVQPAQSRTRAIHHGGERLIDLMRDGSGKLAQRAHARDMRELGPVPRAALRWLACAP